MHFTGTKSSPNIQTAIFAIIFVTMNGQMCKLFKNTINGVQTQEYGLTELL